jgi:3-methyladenine DNA glycosylase AlkD
MQSNGILNDVRRDLQQKADPKTKQSFKRFFKEPMTCYGVKTPDVTIIAKRHLPVVKPLTKDELFTLCETLYAAHYTEEAFIANIWLPHFVDCFKKTDLPIFKRWIDHYLDNWAKVDGFCNHTLGDFIEKYPETITQLLEWTGSKNRWLRRASAVTLIVPAKKGKYLPEAFKIADRLLLDPDDMVQKGYGWLLKEESRTHPQEIFQFVLDRKDRMPRTALRYAIELLPKELKTKAMSKDKKNERKEGKPSIERSRR